MALQKYFKVVAKYNDMLPFGHIAVRRHASPGRYTIIIFHDDQATEHTFLENATKAEMIEALDAVFGGVDYELIPTEG